MSKFKVGDTVRRCRNPSPSLGKFFNGAEFQIAAINERGSMVDPAGGWHDEEYLALVAVSPVRTVTRKEIVSGTYGRLRIDAGLTGTVLLGIEDGIDTPQTHWTEKELRAAAATFIELAEALATPLREGSDYQMEAAQ